MGSGRLAVFACLLACVGLSGARFLTLTVPTHWGVEADMEAEPAAPEREHSREPAGRAGGLQAAGEPLSWRFPEDPVDLLKRPPVQVEMPRQAKGRREVVAVRCGESSVQVEASQDLLGLGRLARPEEVTLGGCSATDVDQRSHVLIFESELHGCGSTLLMTQDAFIYAFTLIYNPGVSDSSPIVRSQSAAVDVECHYPRRRRVSSRSLLPAWTSFRDAAVAEEQLFFSLQLLTDDWGSERPSGAYSPSDVLKLQASVLQAAHGPLRVLVDGCVAASTPDATSAPAHAFIKHHGCLRDGRFRPQSQPERLQFQVQAGSFPLLNTVYITCQLKAVPAASAVTTEHKACSFHRRWRAAAGRDQLCACCDSGCGSRNARSLDADADAEEEWQAEVTLGPLVVHREAFNLFL